MEGYKSEFYSKYVSTHIVGRKGPATLEDFKSRKVNYDKQFGKFLPLDKNARILDIGCGPGSIVWWLHELGYSDARGVDISKEQIEAGVSIGVKNIECVDLGVYLKDKKGCFDMIIARDVFEHFEKMALKVILGDCYEALVSGGKLLIQSPNAESPVFGRIRYGDFTHELAFTSSSISQLLHIAGFASVACFPCNPVFTRVKALPRLVLWKFFEAMYKAMLFAELGNVKANRIVTQNLIALSTK